MARVGWKSGLGSPVLCPVFSMAFWELMSPEDQEDYFDQHTKAYLVKCIEEAIKDLDVNPDQRQVGTKPWHYDCEGGGRGAEKTTMWA